MKERSQFNYAQRWRISNSGNERATQKRIRGFVMFSLIGFLVVGLFAVPWIWQFALRHELEQVEAKIAYYHDVEITLAEIGQLEAQLAQMNNFLGLTAEKSKNPREVITQMRTLLPAGTTITSFSLQADYSVQLGVFLPGPIDLAKLWINLRDSGLFTDFDMNTVSLTDEEKRLNLTLKLNK